MILLKFIMQVDGSICMGTLIDEALEDKTRRVSILQRMATFIREMVGRSLFCTPIRFTESANCLYPPSVTFTGYRVQVGTG